MAEEKKTRHQLLKVFTQYGIHIWAILVIANAVLVYAYQFSTQAAVKSKIKVPNQQANIAANPNSDGSTAPAAPSEPPIPGGPVINLSFSVPGIGSGGGTMKPLHTKRNVTLFLYQTTVNSRDPKVKPLFTIKGSATYDTDPNSGTYTSFINPAFDLGSTVTEGDYQIVFRTDQSMRNVVKENPTDVGGKAFSLTKNQQALVIPRQNMLMGDTIPDDGDYEIDATDYNAFINCYGVKNKTTFCKEKNYGDFNDDGIIDGVDYNILLRSLTVLQQQGFSVPQVAGPAKQTGGRVAPLKKAVTPTQAPKKKAKPTAVPSVAPVQKTSDSGGAAGILIFVFFLILGGGVFFLYKTNEKFRNTIRSLMHLSPTGTPDLNETDPNAPVDPNAPPADPNAVLPSDVATSTEVPAEQPAPPAPEATPAAPTEQTPPQSAEPAPATAAPQTATPAADGTIEKECYVKKKGLDEAGTGEWLLLTDDNGPVEAHYAKKGAVDGFAKVKGVMKTENGKTFLEISELITE